MEFIPFINNNNKPRRECNIKTTGFIPSKNKPALKGQNTKPMGQSLVQNYIHIVFSTKNRKELIHQPHEQRLHAYLGKTCKELNSPILIVGGYTDHIHILCMLSKNISLVDLVKKVKTASSKWMKTQDPEFYDFYWQDGYGAFSVNPKEIEVVKQYIQNQHQHHQSITFKNEYLTLLKNYKTDYDERYLWD